jgi:rod shape-determining protein MreD
MRASRILVALTLAAGAQVLLAAAAPGAAGVLDFFLLLTVYYAVTTNQMTGMLVGTGAGLIQDALLANLVGPSAFAKALIGFLVGRLGMRFELQQTLPHLACVAGATLLQVATWHALHLVLGLPAEVPPTGVIFAQVATNSVAGTIAFTLVRWRKRKKP